MSLTTIFSITAVQGTSPLTHTYDQVTEEEKGQALSACYVGLWLQSEEMAAPLRESPEREQSESFSQ